MIQISQSFYKFPATFQERVLKEITAIIKKGESLQLFGPPGIGNSLLINALTQVDEIKDKYFNKVEDYKFVNLDGRRLLERRPHVLLKQFALSLDSAMDTNIDRVELLDKVEEKIEKICEDNNLVVVVDHVEELLVPELKRFFNNLYQIYRTLESRIGFIFITTEKISHSRDLEDFGNFSRVLVQNFVRNELFNQKDSFWFMEENAKINGLNLNKKQKQSIYKISNGYPRTIKRIVESVARGISLEVITKNPSVDPILKIHLKEISEFEEYSKTMPIFEKFSLQQEGGREIFGEVSLSHDLTKNEAKVFKLLNTEKNGIVTREQGIKAVWGESAIDVSDHAYDQLIHRLRDKIKGASPQVRIQTVRGRGHRLIEV